jgi:hypothetical protein
MARRQKDSQGSDSRGGRSSTRSSGRGQFGTESRSQSRTESGRGSNSPSGSKARHVERVTTDHEVIRRWAEERGAKPARVVGTGANGDVGLIRLMFPGTRGARNENLEEISWDDWFRKFDESGLAFVYDEAIAS